MKTLNLHGFPPTQDHLLEFKALYQNPRVGESLGGPRSDEEVEQMLTGEIKHWKIYGYGVWLFYFEKEFVGIGGIRHTKIEGKDEIEVLYSILPEYWGKGFATEIAKGSLNYATHTLHLQDLICFTLKENIASRRVIEKAGFIFEREGTYKNLLHLIYRFKP